MTSYVDQYKGLVRCNTVGILSYSGPIIIQIILDTSMKEKSMPCSCCPINFKGKLSKLEMGIMITLRF